MPKTKVKRHKNTREFPVKNRAGTRKKRPNHTTDLGQYFVGSTEALLGEKDPLDLHGKVQLILTSPPFPLNHKKKYGNKVGEEYVEWMSSLAPLFSDVLTPNGSIVIEIGNGWLPGRPVQSLLTLEALMSFVKHQDTNLRLCQEFVSYNPSRMPSPAEWVTVERCRVTDSFTHIWWMAKCDYPKADNRRVLRPYSDSMKKLLETKSFNEGTRPSGFKVNKNAFRNDNGGAISHNLFELEDIDPNREARLPNAFSFANTTSTDFYSKTCRKREIEPHPARMPSGLANFFVQFLTEPGDLVLDPFAGSNTTGYVAELNERCWVGIEKNADYAKHSRIRLKDPAFKKKATS